VSKKPLAQVPIGSTWHWQEKGACRDLDDGLFFHPPNERGLARLRRDQRAKQICAGCVVRVECADYAIRSREPYGVWGGLTEEERRLIYRAIPLVDFPQARGEASAMCASEIDDAIQRERSAG
jgi:WhiB family redox-sensing transcriptional regulator